MHCIDFEVAQLQSFKPVLIEDLTQKKLLHCLNFEMYVPHISLRIKNDWSDIFVSKEIQTKTFTSNTN